ncbi:alpha/beta fold hydrolase [Zhihengliuella flava]|uniref:Pimeloyl-ACP methyl ester carboxylesterase n=1 Tax=Zhihengliuella flava TaxID=1285193 RepID=A0A931D455_9MICC|nr:alpha/beta hydrolase [Zhihengliuella flava]MBG6084074.1 pimeloyl-ACP methyl ester carboxylesterase [Zhihengliuella flava]
MDVILIPGFWLSGDSWNAATGGLEASGHRCLAMTLPGKESPIASRHGIGLRTHIDAVVDVLDSVDGPVSLVGHSGGAVIVQGAAEARPEKVGRVIYVDAIPLPDGGVINDELPASGCSLPLPAWDVFEEADLRDLTPELRDQFRLMAVPEPALVATEPVAVSNPARLGIESHVIACEFTEEQIRSWMEAGVPETAELAQLDDLAIHELPTGHWPQLTRPAELGDLLARIVGTKA